MLLRQMVSADTEITCGTIIAYIGRPDEPIPEPEAEQPPVEEEAAQQAAPREASGGPAVSLVIRNLAKREGVDLDRIVGTGPGGRITRADVLEAKQAADAQDRQTQAQE